MLFRHSDCSLLMLCVCSAMQKQQPDTHTYTRIHQSGRTCVSIANISVKSNKNNQKEQARETKIKTQKKKKKKCTNTMKQTTRNSINSHEHGTTNGLLCIHFIVANAKQHQTNTQQNICETFRVFVMFCFFLAAARVIVFVLNVFIFLFSSITPATMGWR